MQKRAQYLFASLATNPKNICGTNLVFERSRDVASLRGKFEEKADKFWPFHSKLIDTVDPVVMIALGGKTYEYLVSRMKNITSENAFPSGHGDWMCNSTKGNLEGKKRTIVGLPSLSRYDIKSHPDVVKWIKSLAVEYSN